MSSITENVRRIKKEIQNGNPFGEQVILVGATKTQTVDAINEAVQAGLDAIAENKPQEFRDKNEFILPCTRHFIGHLQTNKVKYLVGKVELFHSCDRDDVANEIARLSVKNGLISDVLIQINIGEEDSKGGYAYDEAESVVARLNGVQGLRVRGFMAMLPNIDDETTLRMLVRKMRALFDKIKANCASFDYLSMGMSGDYALCIEEGSNMIRLGSTIFGARNYTAV